MLYKKFLTYDQQIERLIHNKNLIIDDIDSTRDKLRNVGYSILISRYEKPFINLNNQKYISGTTIDDIYFLYKFDNDLRGLVFENVCFIEINLRNLISYHFCEIYRDNQKAYLDNQNYRKINSKNLNETEKLDKLLFKLNNFANKNENMPLWILINKLTFGELSKMYSLLNFKIQSNISKNFKDVDERMLGKYLEVLVLYRNLCAHNEKVFSNKIYTEIPDTKLHKRLEIEKKGNQYKYGKKDFFSIVIIFYYLLSIEQFMEFKERLSKLISNYFENDRLQIKSKIFSQMGLPLNWEGKIIR